MIALDIGLLRKIIAHDAASGKMTWKPRTPDMFTPKGQRTAHSMCASFNTRIAGTPALACLDGRTGYLCGNIFGRRYQSHRVLWALVNGEWPQEEIDHINGQRADNRIDNLRSVTKSENAKNKRLLSNNTSGVNGVHWAADRGKWRAEVCIGGKKIKIGSFETFQEAIAAREKANASLGFHENHGKL